MNDQPPEPTPPQRWFRLAEEDLHAGRVLVAEGSAALRIAGFLAQQAAEKALKAGLLASSTHPPRIHGLRQLQQLLPGEPDATLDDDLDVLDPWVIVGRYAADLPEPSLAEAEGLLDAAERVVESVRSIVDAHPERVDPGEPDQE
ncbi:MAG: HEPN domain-containing protein [Actinomycetota bacterium]|nr:HEPN domain-containing protein [Actinomycetota bacterium]